jgi:hypothetical protein
MAKTFISSEERTELQRLYAELPAASQRAAATLRIDGQPLEGEALKRLLAEEAKVRDIVRQIREILGTTLESVPGQNWMEP